MYIRRGFGSKTVTMMWSMFILVILSACMVQGKLHVKKRGSDIVLVKEDYELTHEPVSHGVKESCDCRCRKLHSSEDWKCCRCVWTDEVCFPGDAHVQLPSGHSIPMSALKVGQKVLTVNEDGTPSYTEVLTFLKRHPRTDAVYWNIRTDKSNIRMTPRHIVFTSASNDTATRQPRFAHDVSVGDYLFSASSSNITSSKVLEITSQIMTGVYVPLTETGTLVVDELLASCYSSVDHYIAHAFVTPIRWFPSLFRFHGEDYGMPGYVSFMKWLAHKILPSTYQGRYGQKKSGGELTFTGAHFMSLDL